MNDLERIVRATRYSWYATALGVVACVGSLGVVGMGLYQYHTSAVKAAAQAEWFAVCQATGWKTDVCKLSCKPADRTPAVEVTP